MTDENTGAKVAIGTRGAGEYVGDGDRRGRRRAGRRRRHGGGGARGAGPQKKNQRRDASSPTKPKAANGDENGAKEAAGRTARRPSRCLRWEVDAREARLGGRAAVRGRRGDDGDALSSSRLRRFENSLELLRPRRGDKVVRERERELEVATANGLAAEAWAAPTRGCEASRAERERGRRANAITYSPPVYCEGILVNLRLVRPRR